MLQQQNRPAAFVVDDENVIASTLELILIHKGFDARAFIDPVEALHATRHVSPLCYSQTDAVFQNGRLRKNDLYL